MPTLDFKGKQYVYSHHLSVPFRELKIDTEKSLPKEGEPSLDDNLIIHGDNLHALKALLPRYAGKIDCIYIDPPYNTGKEGWCYNDKVNSPLMREWLEKEANPVDKDDLERHDKWLCMMWPRLQLIHELLSDLTSILNEIFGGECYVGCLPTIMNLKGNNDTYGFVNTHEYTLVYTKNESSCNFNHLKIDEEELEKWDEDDYGLYKRADTLRRTGQDASRERRPHGWFPVFITSDDRVYVTENDKPNSSKDIIIWPVNDNEEELSWSWSKNKISAEPYNLDVINTKNGKNIYKRQRPKLGDVPTKKPKSILYKAEYSTSSSTALLKLIFLNG